MTGPFYTLILELTLPSLAAAETTLPKVIADRDPCELPVVVDAFLAAFRFGEMDVRSVAVA